MTACRSGEHVIRDGRDRAPNGGCRACANRNSREYRERTANVLAEARRLAELTRTT
jgi:hypothetical protein